MSHVSKILSLLVLCSAALGQQMPIGTTPRMMLAMSPDVKKEIKLTKDQEKKILTAMQDFAKSAQSGQFGAGFNMANPMAAMDPLLEPILNDAQKQRLEELFIQLNGGYALTDPKVAAALELADGQKEQVEAIDKEATEELTGMLSSVKSNKDLKAAKAKHKEFGEKIRALLTAEQAAKFVAMQGKAFKFKG